MATTPAIGQASRADAAIDPMIEQDPHRPGRHHARLVDTGTHVWVVIGALRRSHGDVAKIAREWNLSEEAVRAALGYYERHRALFDAFFLLEEEEHRCRIEPCFG